MLERGWDKGDPCIIAPYFVQASAISWSLRGAVNDCSNDFTSHCLTLFNRMNSVNAHVSGKINVTFFTWLLIKKAKLKLSNHIGNLSSSWFFHPLVDCSPSKNVSTSFSICSKIAALKDVSPMLSPPLIFRSDLQWFRHLVQKRRAGSLQKVL